MEPAGHWELTDDEGGGTRVTFVMTPTPRGLFKVLAPLMAMSLRKGSPRALQRLKERLESSS